MRREGDVCRPDSLVRPVPLPEHLLPTQKPIIENVTENERDKETITEGPKDEVEGEQDTGTRNWNWTNYMRRLLYCRIYK